MVAQDVVGTAADENARFARGDVADHVALDLEQGVVAEHVAPGIFASDERREQIGDERRKEVARLFFVDPFEYLGTQAALLGGQVDELLVVDPDPEPFAMASPTALPPLPSWRPMLMTNLSSIIGIIWRFVERAASICARNFRNWYTSMKKATTDAIRSGQRHRAPYAPAAVPRGTDVEDVRQEDQSRHQEQQLARKRQEDRLAGHADAHKEIGGHPSGTR